MSDNASSDAARALARKRWAKPGARTGPSAYSLIQSAHILDPDGTLELEARARAIIAAGESVAR